MSDTHHLKKPAAEMVQEFVADASLAIEIGDLMYHDANDAKPASSQADQLTESANQVLFASKFCGVAVSKRLSTQDTAGVVRVQTDGLYEFPCVSNTFEIGDLIAADEAASGTALEDQQVRKTNDPMKAIGVVVERYGSATTKVWARIQSRVSDNLALAALGFQSAGTFVQPYIPVAARQNITAGTGGAVNVTSYYTSISTDAGGDAYTLADGSIIGQLKKIQLIVDGGGDGVLTPTNLSGGTTITFADAGDFALLLWNGTQWVAIELGNDADGATAPVLA